MNSLSTLGWTPQLQTEYTTHASELRPARVIAVDRDSYLAASDASLGSETLRVTLAGRLRHLGCDAIAVGDWVALHENRIDYRFARRSTFARKRVGESSAQQVIASNVDWTLIAMSMNENFSPQRVERFVIAAWDAGTTPVVLLTKCDLAEDTDTAIESVVDAAAGCEIICTSSVSGEGMDRVRDIVGPGQTAVLVGSSGVGKSTIVNALLGAKRLSTGDIRESDAKGRHTTTRRELIPIPKTGGLIIDTPGIREFGVLAPEDGDGGLSQGFSDIEDLAEHCDFRDCAHKTEPNCAVQDSVDSGKLSQARVDSYFKLLRELEHNERRHDVAKRRQGGKALSVLIRKHTKSPRW
ncbi:MAG: ribosome small subunit-dependent GTPase A [Myxococcales bacterium]|nr:ribosome small subunit-dependent GTPase A [Myxococcales bacterium]